MHHQVLMHGVGTTGTATGLSFSCGFQISFVALEDLSQVPGCECRLHVQMNYDNKPTPNFFEHACPCLANFQHTIDPHADQVLMEENVNRRNDW